MTCTISPSGDSCKTIGGNGFATISEEALPGSLTSDQMRELEENGYVTLPKVASAQEMAEIREIIERLFAEKAGHREGAHFNFAGPEDDPDAPSFPQIIAPHNYADGLRKTAFYARAKEIARQILGPEARFGSDHTLMKPALNGPATPWHQDEAFRNPEYDYREVSIWMPLQDVDEVNGCMRYIPGSQRGEVLPHGSPNDDPRVHGLECRAGFDPREAVPCPLPAGGCAIHSGRTLHAAGPNRSTAPRLAYVLNFAIPPVPAAVPRTFPWLAGKQTDRLQRMRAWMLRGGMVIETWRLIKRTEPQDYGKLLARLLRKMSLLWTLMKG